MTRLRVALQRDGAAIAALRTGLYGMEGMAALLRILAGPARDGEEGRLREFADWLNEVVYTVRIKLRLRRDSALGGVHDFHELDLPARRRSDTVFILGSGASINRITTAQWEEITAHDTMALNFWPIHDVVPGMLFFETRTQFPERNAVFFHLLHERAADYGGVPLVHFTFEPGVPEGFPPTLRDHLHLLNTTRSTFTLRGMRRSLRAAAWIHRNTTLGIEAAINPGSQLGMLAMLCLLAGYRNIVLLGVDLHDSRYFWETAPERFAHRPKPPRIQTSDVHATYDRAQRAVPIDVFLTEMLEVFGRDREVTLYCGSTTSALAALMPVWSFATTDGGGT